MKTSKPMGSAFWDENDQSTSIVVDWDLTLQNSEENIFGKKLAQYGSFNINLIKKLNQYIDKGGNVAIASAGAVSREAKKVVNGDLDLSDFRAEVMKFYFEKNKEDHAEILKFLNRVPHFCNIKKGYGSASNYEIICPRYFKDKTVLDNLRDEVWDGGRFIEIDKVRSDGEDSISLKDFASEPGKIMVVGDSMHDQIFARKLSFLMAKEVVVIDGTINGAKNTFDHSVENDLPAVLKRFKDIPFFTTPSSRLTTISNITSLDKEGFDRKI